MIPFSDIVNGVAQLAGRVRMRMFRELKSSAPQGGGSQRWEADVGTFCSGLQYCFRLNSVCAVSPVKNVDHPDLMHAKHRPRIAGGGENIPLEVIRSLTIWLSVLERRGTVPGALRYHNLLSYMLMAV